MPSVKIEFRTHGNEAKPADFQMLLKRMEVKKNKIIEPRAESSLV